MRFGAGWRGSTCGGLPQALAWAHGAEGADLSGPRRGGMGLRGHRGEVGSCVCGGSGGHLWSSAALLLGCSAPRPRVLGYSAPRREGLERSWDEVLLHGKVLHKGSSSADLSPGGCAMAR